MPSIEKTAKTADEAIRLALDELGLTRDQVEVEILEEQRSLFGILGSSQARVRVRSLVSSIGDDAARLLAEMLSLMGLDAAAEVVEEDESQVVINITGDEMGLLIGKHGQTLAALQHLLGLIANRHQEHRKRIILDAEGYRDRREESLRHLALASARRAKHTGEAVTLEPLLPHERRIIHTALADDTGVTTHSVGDEPVRRVVIEPRRGPRPRGAGRDRSGYQPDRGRAPRAPSQGAPEEGEPQHQPPDESEASGE